MSLAEADTNVFLVRPFIWDIKKVQLYSIQSILELFQGNMTHRIKVFNCSSYLEENRNLFPMICAKIPSPQHQHPYIPAQRLLHLDTNTTSSHHPFTPTPTPFHPGINTPSSMHQHPFTPASTSFTLAPTQPFLPSSNIHSPRQQQGGILHWTIRISTWVTTCKARQGKADRR